MVRSEPDLLRTTTKCNTIIVQYNIRFTVQINVTKTIKEHG